MILFLQSQDSLSESNSIISMYANSSVTMGKLFKPLCPNSLIYKNPEIIALVVGIK